MSSITSDDLKDILSDVPDDYEVIMEIKTRHPVEAGTSIAYINGISVNHDYKEIRLMN